MAAFLLQQDHPLEASLPLIVQVELSDKRYGCRRYPAAAANAKYCNNSRRAAGSRRQAPGEPSKDHTGKWHRVHWGCVPCLGTG